MSISTEDYFKEGLVNIIGSCCGSTPAHTLEIAKKAASYKPREFQHIQKHSCFTGLDVLTPADNIIHINDTVLPDEGDYEGMADAARDMIDAGASIIKVKTDDEKTINGFLDYALMNPYVAKVPFFISSCDFNVLQTALKRLQGKSLAGPIDLEREGAAEFLRKAEIILRYGAAALVSASSAEAAVQAYNLLKENNYPADHIVFEQFEGGQIKENCPGVFIAV
jgi:5-methyltetrahydrofolate--homocysteine methyltransferase